MNDRMIRTNVHLTEKQLAMLRRLSKSSGVPVAELIRRAIEARYWKYSRAILAQNGRVKL